MWQYISEDKLEEARLETRRDISKAIVMGKQEETRVLMNTSNGVKRQIKERFLEVNRCHSLCDSPPLSLTPCVLPIKSNSTSRFSSNFMSPNQATGKKTLPPLNPVTHYFSFF